MVKLLSSVVENVGPVALLALKKTVSPTPGVDAEPTVPAASVAQLVVLSPEKALQLLFTLPRQ